jgi:hypothetical protein
MTAVGRTPPIEAKQVVALWMTRCQGQETSEQVVNRHAHIQSPGHLGELPGARVRPRGGEQEPDATSAASHVPTAHTRRIKFSVPRTKCFEGIRSVEIRKRFRCSCPDAIDQAITDRIDSPSSQRPLSDPMRSVVSRKSRRSYRTDSRYGGRVGTTYASDVAFQRSGVLVPLLLGKQGRWRSSTAEVSSSSF